MEMRYFMALKDWNHNGKKDLSDDFIEYMLCTEIMEDQKKKDQYDESHQNYYGQNNFSDKDEYSHKAQTTDGKKVSGEDINGCVVVLALLVAAFALLILYAAVKIEDTVSSIMLILLGIAVAVFGKWLLMGKRAIKKDAHEKYGIKDEDKDNDKEDF